MVQPNAVFNKQPIIPIMIYAKTIINDVEVIAFSDGSVSLDRRVGAVRTFGHMARSGYRRLNIGGVNTLIHRVVAQAFDLDLKNGRQVDHIDGDKSNNKLTNLRSATPRDNTRAFQKPRKSKTSQYRGVWRDKTLKSRYWRAEISISGKSKKLGNFSKESDAARAYDAAAKKYGFPSEAMNF